jgi:hypothetical protein
VIVRELKILSAKYVRLCYMEPYILLELEFSADNESVRVDAYLGEISAVLYKNNLVPLVGKSAEDRKNLSRYLQLKQIPELPDVEIDNVSGDPKILRIARHLFDAVNFRNGAKFVAGEEVPQYVLGKSFCANKDQ